MISQDQFYREVMSRFEKLDTKMDSQYNELKNEISQLKTWKESHTSAINAVDDYKTDQAQKTDRKVYVAIGILGVAVGIIEVIKRFGL